MKYQELEFNRLNEPYRPALFLAKLLLDHIMFSGSEGEEPFLAFLVDMNWLFEKVVWTIINQHSSDLGVTAQEQKYYPLDKASLVSIQPDVVLYHQNLPTLVLDAKYKLDPNRADVYQVMAYCHALGLERAVLVHPESEELPTTELFIREPGDIKINYLSIDLSGDPSEIEVSSRGFIEKVRKILLPIKLP
jgi:5-methylcytosine-specific restriction enzyme subunit McrC